jgi:hypothetical protein
MVAYLDSMVLSQWVVVVVMVLDSIQSDLDASVHLASL